MSIITTQYIEEATQYLRERLPSAPEVGLVLGSGLGELAEDCTDSISISYEDIPYFQPSTAPDHVGRLVCGTLSGRFVLCMQGRLHGYEGYAPDEIAFPVYVMKALGIQALILTNASGSINTAFSPGDLMIIDDHINMTGRSSLTAFRDTTVGERFPDMTFAYSPILREKADQAAQKCGITLRHGIYCGVNGPQFETPAEIRAFRILGADAVGMSTIFEAIAAAHCKLPVLGVSMITNMAAGVLMQSLSGAEVNEIALQYGAVFRRFATELVRTL